MAKLSRASLWSLEEYAQQRPTFRTEVIAHKKNRRVGIGAHATLCFEDELTMKYQVQEMLRTERIFEASGIEEELTAYNPLIPDGSNWKRRFSSSIPMSRSGAASSPSWAASNTRCGCKWATKRRFSRSPTRTWTAAPMAKPRPYTSCALSCRNRCAPL